MGYVIAVPEIMGVANPIKSKHTIYIPKDFNKKPAELEDFIYDTANEALDRMEYVLLKIDYLAKDLLYIFGKYRNKTNKCAVQVVDKEYKLYKNIILNCIMSVSMLDVDVQNPLDLIDIFRENNYGILLVRSPNILALN